MKRAAALVPLSREHNTALVLALRITREVPDGDAQVLGAVYDELIGFWARGLLPHFRAENECLLARLVRHVAPNDELVRRTHRDHLSIEALVADMRDNAELEYRRGRLLAFAETLRTHVRWEEDVLFEETQAKLTPEEMDRLGADILERVGPGMTGLHEV